MRRFIRKSILFPICFLGAYMVVFISANAYLNRVFDSEGVIFVWGDSQAYQGVDLEELSNEIGKKVYTSAHHGAGVYDFLLFTERVPENSNVIISISKLVQVRRKENDYNRSGLSFWAMKNLFKNGYSLSEIRTVVLKNIKPHSNISETTELYAYADSMRIQLPLSHFRDYYQKIPIFLGDKQNLYLIGIENLILKNCEMTFIEFPYHRELESIENQSPIKKKTDDFIFRIGSLFNEFKTDTLWLSKDQNNFSDLSHLNSVGANQLSKQLGEKMTNNERTTMYIVR